MGDFKPVADLWAQYASLFYCCARSITFRHGVESNLRIPDCALFRSIRRVGSCHLQSRLSYDCYASDWKLLSLYATKFLQTIQKDIERKLERKLVYTYSQQDGKYVRSSPFPWEISGTVCFFFFCYLLCAALMSRRFSHLLLLLGSCSL